MTKPQEKIEPDMDALEKQLTLPPAKSFAPPQGRGIHEHIDEILDLIGMIDDRMKIVKKRLSEFDRLQSNFYNGHKP